MRKWKRRVAMWAAGLVVLAAAGCATDGENGAESAGQSQRTVIIARGVDTTRPECPVAWEFADTAAANQSREAGGLLISPGVAPGELPIAGLQTDIPEFNDCQRFILSGGRFGALFAVFASKDLVEAEFKPAGRAGGRGGRGDSGSALVTEGTAVAAVFTPDGTYPELGIVPGITCLYLSRDPVTLEMQAAMAPARVADCDDPYLTGGITRLYVRERQLDQWGPYASPPVSRWETTRTTGHYVIGIKCGQAWCQVAPMAIRAAAQPAHEFHDGYALAGQPTDAAQFAVNGWHDEQMLAVSVNGVVQPSGVWGLAVPDSKLGTYGLGDFGTWQPVARIFLSEASEAYRGKLNVQGPNYEPASGRVTWDSGNQISLCTGTRQQCVGGVGTPPATLSGTEWWARIISARLPGIPSDTAYRPVTRCDHADLLKNYGFGVAATARWRWVADDETLWVRCVEGCCEVHPWDAGT